jgi:hypothetical protein
LVLCHYFTHYSCCKAQNSLICHFLSLGFHATLSTPIREAGHKGILQMDDKIAWDKIKMPKQSHVERVLGGHYRKRAEKFITEKIKEHAVDEDGKIDNELADYIRKKLTQRTEVSMQRDVVEPTGWAFASGVVSGTAAMAISKKIEGRALTKTSAFATVAGTAVGVVLDLYRMNRRFDSAMRGTLAGALRAMQEERSPHAEKRRRENADYHPFDVDMEQGGGRGR